MPITAANITLVVACALVDSDGRVLVAARPSGKSMAGLWEFPGGKVEAGDASPVATALREAEEEIGLAADYVEVAGFLDTYQTGTGFLMLPVVSFVQPGFTLTPDKNEVADIF